MLGFSMAFASVVWAATGTAPQELEVGLAPFFPRLEPLFDSLDLSRAELAAVESAVSARDWGQACAGLVDHYRHTQAPVLPYVSVTPAGEDVLARADAVLRDEMTFYDQTATVPRNADGGLQWDFTGPAGDKEWAWALNRHFHLDWLLDAYLQTRDPKYAAAWDAHVRDWVLHNPFAEPEQNPLVWRGLETFFRVRAWARGFFALQNEDAFTAETRVLLLSSIPDHARYLRNFHKDTSNWIAMELNGLAIAGVAWPEFKDSESWVNYSVDRLTKELSAQVYPDGAQMELTASYHRVTLWNFQGFAELIEKNGYTLPDAFASTVENMWNYLAYTLQPAGYSPLNNDSDLDLNAPRLIDQAAVFDRPDWAYVASNGAQGTQPNGSPSRSFGWAGQLISRSGWDRDAHWSFFDLGPMGIGHYHFDKLHFSLSAHGRDILVDGGRYTYMRGDWRKYFIGSASHNVILIDGQGQLNHPSQSDSPLDSQMVIARDYDLAYGRFDGGFSDVPGEAIHERLVYYQREAFWIVIDRIQTDRPRHITALWHFHPECTVAVDNLDCVSTDDAKGNVRIAPSGTAWSVAAVKGQESPSIQGWWSREYNHKAPSSTAVYEMDAQDSVAFAWLLLPAKGIPPAAALDLSIHGDTAECTVKSDGLNEKLAFRFTATPVRIE